MSNDDTPTTTPGGILLVADVAKMFGVKPSAVTQWMKHSRREFVGSKPARYAKNPFPAPDGFMYSGKKVPWWRTSRVEEIREWDKRRLTIAHGTGGRRKKPPAGTV